MELYLDKTRSPEERAADLLERMSIAEKMGQVVCFWPRLLPTDDATFDEQYTYGAGQLSLTYMRMIKTRKDSVEFQRKWQTKVMEKSPHHIPAICHLEGVCGATIQDAVSFPNGLARAASFNPALEEKVGEVIGRQESCMGISHLFAPVLDINRDPRNGRLAETYGEDPTLVSAMGAAYSRGVQDEHGTEQRIETVAKHFCGFHGSSGGVQSSSFEVSDRTYREIYAKPFQACITSGGLRGIMPCYTPINGEGTSSSSRILNDILRKEMGFDGLVVSDYTGVAKLHERNKLYDSLEDAGYMCLAAGMDFETPLKKAYSDILQEQFEKGERDVKVLDDAVFRILREKFRMGLFEHPFAMAEEDLKKVYYHEEDKDISKRCALESMVLVKNNGILPMVKAPKTIAVIGCHARSARFFFGGYTHYSTAEGNYAIQHEMDKKAAGISVETYPGTPILRSDEENYEQLLKDQKPECISLLAELTARYQDSDILYSYGYDCIGTDESYFQAAIETVEKADLVIMTLGGKHGTRKIATMGEGTDSTNICIPYTQAKLIGILKELGKPMIGVHLDGRPISSDEADTCLDAILEAWSPSEYGAEAIVDVLSGEYNPCGRFPVSVAFNSGQVPVYYNSMNGSSFTPYTSIGVYGAYLDCPHEPRYPFGYGLSYTSFEYSNLMIENREECVFISCDITNIGDRNGTEVVQLYVSDDYSTVLRPVQELAGFGRVTLEVGETRKVHFNVQHGQLGFYSGEGTFTAERGRYTVRISASSVDIRLEGKFLLERDIVFDGRTRGFWADFNA